MTPQRLNWFLEIIRQPVFRRDLHPWNVPVLEEVSSA
jgi:hypothetical protein